MSHHDSPGGGHPVIYVESEPEQRAWLVATFGEEDRWSIVSETVSFVDGQQREVLEIELSSGDRIHAPFGEAAAEDALAGGRDRTTEMDDLMEHASNFAEANPPHHPGSLPRFPVPATGYTGAVAIPMPVLAVDASGVRGLYAPPRQVIIRRDDRSLVGVGEFPGFDPQYWPPPRLGDWPPTQLRGIPAAQLQATIARFSACWSRVMDAWFGGVTDPGPELVADIKESLYRRAFLDLMTLLPYYDRLNPAFAAWLTRMVAEGASRA